MGRKRACDVCYKKKIQCDGDGAQCDWCIHHDLACTYDRPSKRRTSSAAGYKSDQSVAKRIERLELILNAVKQLGDVHKEDDAKQQTGEDSVTAAFHRQVHISEPLENPELPAVRHNLLFGGEATVPSELFHLGRFYLAGHHIGGISSSNCMPFFSEEGYNWIRARTGEEPLFTNLRIQQERWQDEAQRNPPSSIVPSASDTVLPDRALVEALASKYCTSHAYAVFPVIDPVLFQKTIEQVYEPTPSHSRVTIEAARTSIIAFIALVSIFSVEFDMEVNYDSQLYTDIVTCSSLYLFGEPSVSSCQTLVMLALSRTLSGYESKGMMVHSLACRSLLMLDAHTLSPRVAQVSAVDNERVKIHLRRLFWVSYTMDKEISLRTGLAPCFPDEFLDLTPPEMFTGNHGHGTTPDSTSYAFPINLRHNIEQSIIKSKISRLLYSESAFKNSEVETLLNIRELDDELETRRQSLPEQWRPRLDYSDDEVMYRANSSMPMPSENHKAMGMLGYYHLLGAIHRASGRCRAWPGMKGRELEGISSSLAISIHASRLTLLCLRETHKSIVDYCFWVLVFYPMSAVLALFCNIITNPLDPHVPSDLEQIEAVPGYLRHLRQNPRTPQDRLFLTMVEELCAELVRLGKCAVVMAQNNHETMPYYRYEELDRQSSSGLSSQD